MTNWVYRGRCHKFGDAIPLDDGFIPFNLAIGRVMDPAKLTPHLFEDVRPGFAATAKPGDIVVGGRKFACGKPHVQGFIALRALGVGLVCESMPYNSFRGAVSQGLRFMTGCDGVTEMVADGDEIEVDFAEGRLVNLTQLTERTFTPLAKELRDIIAGGGAQGSLATWWRRQQHNSVGV